MRKFEFIRNWTQRFRFTISTFMRTFWRFLAGKIGIRREPSDRLPIPPAATRVIVEGESIAESHEKAVYADTAGNSDRRSEWELKGQPDIDFGRLDDLEAFAEEMTVPKETIERWVAAGILSPVEIRVAERLIKIMREKDRKNGG